jgi:hypothetical protein
VVDFMKRAGEVPVVTSISVEGFPVPGSKGEADAREDLRLWQEAVRKETAEYRKDQAHVELVPLPPMKFMEPSPMPTVPADMSPRHDGVLCYTNENGELVMKSEPMELVTSIGNLSAIKKLELYDDKTKPIVPPDVVSLVASTLENLHYSAGDTILLTQADADAIEDFCGEGVEWAEPKPASPPEPMVSPDHLSARCLAWARLNNPNVTPEQLERMWPGMGDYARRVDGYAETKRPAAADLEVGTYEKEGCCTAATTRGTTSVSAHARGLRSRRAGSAG